MVNKMPYWLFIVIGLSLLTGIVCSLVYKNWTLILLSIPAFIGITTLWAFSSINITADNPHYSQRYTENTSIYSLRTTELTNGEFVLCSGSINSETYYIYYSQDNEGAYSINRLKASECKIFMDRDKGAVLTKVWGKINDENLSKHWGWSEVIFKIYEFHLPYGSLIQEYSVK
jgi:hypothetical protein